MEITLQYFDDCPNWETIDGHLRTLSIEGLDATVRHEVIDTYEVAMARGFCGSPTLLIDGVDPFTDRKAMIGLACRVYLTQHGPAGSPTIEQLRTAITAAERRH